MAVLAGSVVTESVRLGIIARADSLDLVQPLFGKPRSSSTSHAFALPRHAPFSTSHAPTSTRHVPPSAIHAASTSHVLFFVKPRPFFDKPRPFFDKPFLPLHGKTTSTRPHLHAPPVLKPWSVLLCYSLDRTSFCKQVTIVYATPILPLCVRACRLADHLKIMSTVRETKFSFFSGRGLKPFLFFQSLRTRISHVIFFGEFFHFVCCNCERVTNIVRSLANEEFGVLEDMA